MNQEFSPQKKKQGSITYSKYQENQVSKIIITSLCSNKGGEISIQINFGV